MNKMQKFDSPLANSVVEFAQQVVHNYESKDSEEDSKELLGTISSEEYIQHVIQGLINKFNLTYDYIDDLNHDYSFEYPEEE